MAFEFELNDGENFLLGIQSMHGISERVDNGEINEEFIISIGFLIFSIHIVF